MNTPFALRLVLSSFALFSLVAFASAQKLTPETQPDLDPWVVYEGGEGPGQGQHVILIAGDEEYRSEESMPMLARILATHHGFKCTVLFSTNPESGEVDPKEQTNIPGMHLLESADMLVCLLRFRELPDEDMAHFVKYVESGKPILGIRTSTHAFAYSRNKQSPYAKYSYNSQEWPGGFGRQILGDTWINHHGHHGKQSTRGVLESTHASHPILTGVLDVWGPTDVYGVRNLPASATVLLRGAVLEDMTPTSKPIPGAKNDPMMPLAWTRELPQKDGTNQRVICSTIGASMDCESADLRRFFVNACYWGLRLEDKIVPDSSVDIVGKYEPTAFGFDKFQRGKRPRDF
jgi:hypothetical protein